MVRGDFSKVIQCVKLSSEAYSCSDSFLPSTDAGIKFVFSKFWSFVLSPLPLTLLAEFALDLSKVRNLWKVSSDCLSGLQILIQLLVEMCVECDFHLDHVIGFHGFLVQLFTFCINYPHVKMVFAWKPRLLRSQFPCLLKSGKEALV